MIPPAPYDYRPYHKHPNIVHLQWWKDRVWLACNGVCQCCKRHAEYVKRMEAHHVTYERFGQEAVADGALMCGDCHDSVTDETRFRRVDREVGF